MKKIFIFGLGLLSVTMVASAQTVTGSGAGGSGSAGPAIIISPTPVLPPPTSATGFVQFNSLTIQSISSQTAPAEIVAGMKELTPAMGASAMPCYQFQSESDSAGTAITCPIPPSQNAYRIEVGASTELMLRDRTAATLANLSIGDQINIFGYYNTDGSIQAYLIRDISKPIETQTIQLNNVTLVSISGTSIPATLAVTQSQGAPCYSFTTNGAQQPYACPMGISSFSANAATQNIVAPSAEPNYMMLRKYAITVDAQTIILDRNRNQLSLANLNLEDQLNIYGETSDNGQTVNADIIRDLSIPATPSTYTGTITQVNSDGSFVIQTNGGQTITVPGPIQVGASVSVTGLLGASNILSSVSRVMIGNSVTTPPTPIEMPMLRINGSSTPPTTSHGPNIY